MLNVWLQIRLPSRFPSLRLLLSLDLSNSLCLHEAGVSSHRSSFLMALTTSKLSRSPSLTDRNTISRSCGTTPSFESSIQLSPVHPSQIEQRHLRRGPLLSGKLKSSKDILRRLCGKPLPSRGGTRGSSVLCFSTGTPDTEATECARQSGDSSNRTSAQIGEDKDDPLIAPYGTTQSRHCLAEACRFVQNDAKFVNERARNDIVLLSRGIMRLDARARQDVAILSSEFLKLDARVREDTEKIDRKVKKKAERLSHIATILKNKAESKLKTAADQHWSDGALELVGPIDILAPASKHLINFNPPRYVNDNFGVSIASFMPWDQADLRLADFRAKQRALEDSLMALEFIKNIHDRMVSKMYKFPLPSENDSISSHDVMGRIMLEKNGKMLDSFPGEVSADRISAIQGAYWSMASALSEADGIDYTDPEELELLVTTLIDLDAMDGKSSVSLLAECSSSPDVSTRRALANALATAPSMWTLGNAGMGALQRLAQDSNPSIATAASKAMYELKKQWEIEEGDNWRFTMDKDQKVDDADT